MITTLINSSLATTKPSFWMPEQASDFAGEMDFVFYFITWLSVFFFVLIVALLVFFSWKYRRRTHVANVPAITHNTPLELTWTILPLILVIAIFYVGMKGYVKLREPPIGAYVVNVTGAKWQWSFTYPEEQGLTDTALYVPQGRPVRLVMKSNDVLHSMFIPAFRVKQDVVPGRITDLWFRPTTPGEYDVVCAEYCGTGHSTMTTRVHVLPPDEFKAKMQELGAVFEKASKNELPYLALTKLYPRCKSCHTLDGSTGIGPSWRGMWEDVEKGNVVFTDGTVLKDLIGPGKLFATPEDYVYQSILNPQQKIVENYPGSMPTFKGQLSERQLDALLALFKQLDEKVDNDGEWIGPVPQPEEGGAEGNAEEASTSGS